MPDPIDKPEKEVLMLQFMRDIAKSWVVKALMALLIVSFGIWGIGDIFRGNPQHRTVAKIGPVAVSVQALEVRFQKDLPEARQTLGPDMTVTQARQMGVLDNSLKGMIENVSLDLETKRLGLNISPQSIMAQIAAEPKFRDEQGRFNTQLWHQVLGKAGLTEKGFLDEEAKDTARRLVVKAIVDSAYVPDLVVDHLYQARGDKRIVEVLTLKNDSIDNIPAPDDKALREFYDKNQGAFSAPEYRSLTIAQLSADDAAKDITVSDDDVKKAYEERADQFKHEEQRDIVQVVVPDEDKAKAVADTAQSGRDLRAAAKARGFTPTELNKIDSKELLPELVTPVFGLKENEISAPLKSALGWHVVQVKKVYPAGTTPFEEVKVQLRDEIQREKASDETARVVNQLDDSLAAGHSLEDIADSLKLRLVKIPAIGSDGLDPQEQEPKELPSKDDVLKTAFGQGAGETSSILDDRQGHYIVVRTDNVTATHVIPLDQIRTRVASEWRKDQQRQLAAKQAEDMAKTLRDGGKTAPFAARKGVDVWMSKPISLLGETDVSVPPTALPKILKMKKDEVITHQEADKAYVMRLAAIEPVDPAKPDSSRLKVVDDLSRRSAFDLVDQYVKHLRELFPVRINEELMASLRTLGEQ